MQTAMYIATTQDHVIMLAYIVRLETTSAIYIVPIHCLVRACKSSTRTMSTYIAVEIGHVLGQAYHQRAERTVYTPYNTVTYYRYQTETTLLE